MSERDPRRALPSVDALLQAVPPDWASRHGRAPVVAALREALEGARHRLSAAPAAEVPTIEGLVGEAGRRLATLEEPGLRRVLNGTGVVLHTNLGRAPLAEEAREACLAAAGYGNVELDLARGVRGSRYDHCAPLLRELTGAGGALVVNNNAAAVSLCVNEFARDREVIVSRGELVEIGGSFRIPDVVARSGARLVEVGTTNRTRPDDVRRALGPETGLLLKVHPSNYRVEGFTESVPLDKLVEIGRGAGLPVVHDIGSGLLRRELLPDFPDEPTVVGSLAAGVDVVTCSGDKLLGGPQAGLVLGSPGAIERLRANPLLRAFRVDKITLAALEATLALHRDPQRAIERIPVLRALRERVADMERRAQRARERLPAPLRARVSVERVPAVAGGGSFPGLELPSAAWVVRGPGPDALAARCRRERPPLVGRIRDGAFHVDFRALAEEDEEEVARVLSRALGAT